MFTALNIIEDDLSGADVQALLRLHLDEMHAWSPPCSVHAMPAERLRSADVTFWSAWYGSSLAGCGAIRRIDARHGEIKSMRTHSDFRGKGVGKSMLVHLIAQAQVCGYARLSLETGPTDHFVPARGLYQAHGFTLCGPFAEYEADPFSVFMSKVL